MRLYEYADKYRELMDNLEADENGEIIGLEALENAEADFILKAEAVACYILELDAEIDARKAAEKRLAELRKALERKEEHLRKYLADQMIKADQTKIETANTRVSFRKSTSVEISNLDELPPEYLETKLEMVAKKDLIKKAIVSGEDVRGAQLITKQNLQIK